MARTLKPQEYAEKRSEILNVVQRLVYSKGFAQMTIQDVLDELKISKGAFYHYFDSKQALLEGLTERMIDAAEQIIIPIVNDPTLSALLKFRQFLDSMSSWKLNQKGLVIGILRAWFADDNALVRQRVNALIDQRIAPLFSQIVRQGIAEGTFTTAYPDRVGSVILSLLVGLQNAIGALLFEDGTHLTPQQKSAQIVACYDVYFDALERTLGAQYGTVFRVEIETVQVWLDALQTYPS